jgi:glycosyltransferase involved in cell wall biosynthesis
MKKPRISIVTPSFNQKDFLENTIRSVLEQGYPNLEYIIMDGGSTDGSVEIIQKYAHHLAYWQSQPDGGQVCAINAGFQRATGEILTFLNSDDFLLEGAITHIVELYRTYPKAAGWVGGGHSITEDGYIIHTRLPQKLDRDNLADWGENWFNQPGCFFSAEAARAVGFLDPTYQLAFDFEFWLRLTAVGELIPSPKVIAASTIHLDAKTQIFKVEIYKENQAVQLAHGYEALAHSTQKYIDQTSSQTLTGTLAKLLFVTHHQKKFAPDRYVRFPSKFEDD